MTQLQTQTNDGDAATAGTNGDRPAPVTPRDLQRAALRALDVAHVLVQRAGPVVFGDERESVLQQRRQREFAAP